MVIRDIQPTDTISKLLNISIVQHLRIISKYHAILGPLLGAANASRWQAVIQTTGGDHQGLWGMLAGIVRNEGWLSLYQGVGELGDVAFVNCDT